MPAAACRGYPVGTTAGRMSRAEGGLALADPRIGDLGQLRGIRMADKLMPRRVIE